MKTEQTSPYQISASEADQIRAGVLAWQSKSFHKILFVCTANYQRSKTSEDLFKAATDALASSADVSRHCINVVCNSCSNPVSCDQYAKLISTLGGLV